MDVITYDDLEKSFQAQAGLITLDATDKFFFVNSLNLRLRDAWSRAKWPELIQVGELALADNAPYGKSTPQVNYDILNVYDKNPYSDITARTLFYTLIDSRVQVNIQTPVASIFVLKKIPFTSYDENSADIPVIFQSYLVAGILSDFFRGDNQYDKAQAEEARAEEALLKQIDRVERLQNQNTPLVGNYTLNQTRNIFQTT